MLLKFLGSNAWRGAFLVLLACLFLFTSSEVPRVGPTLARAQIGTRFVWSDSIVVNTTATDSTFSQRWEYVTFYADTVDFYYRAGAPDVASWTSRKWILVPNGSVVSFGPATPLVRLEFKTKAGTGNLYMIGAKTTRQF
jgi:hypothetical protein